MLRIMHIPLWQKVQWVCSKEHDAEAAKGTGQHETCVIFNSDAPSGHTPGGRKCKSGPPC